MRFLIALVTLAAPTASAFNVYKSSETGAPLRWFQSGIVVTIDTTPPATVAADPAIEQIQQGFQVWSNLACSGESVPFDFSFQLGDGVVGYDEEGGAAGNNNLVVWIAEDWPHETNVTGLTTLTFDTITGQIVDADMELNEVNFTFSLSGEPARADVLNTIVHETGHVLGLDHSSIRDSTMFATADLGEVKKRSLHVDDLEGYCSLYGPDALPLPDSQGGGTLGGGCSAGGSGRNPVAPALLLALVGLALSRRWRDARSR